MLFLTPSVSIVCGLDFAYFISRLSDDTTSTVKRVVPLFFSSPPTTTMCLWAVLGEKAAEWIEQSSMYAPLLVLVTFSD